MSTRQSKKEKFQQPQKSKKGMVLTAVFLLAALSIGIAIYSGSAQKDAFAFNVGTNILYPQSPTEQTPVSYTEDGDKMVLSLGDVLKKRFVKTVWEKEGKKVPITAYLSYRGDLVVAVSVCEPCNGDSFRIEGKHLICNVCSTTWDIDNLEGISGGCMKYPPEVLKYSVDGNKIMIDQKLLQDWQPREL